MGLSPYRVFRKCMAGSKYYREDYNKDGINSALIRPMKLSKWLLQSNPCLASFLLLITIMLSQIFYVIESIVTAPWNFINCILLTIVLLGAVAVFPSQRMKKLR